MGLGRDMEVVIMAAIELASTEGFTRRGADVSLRRLGHFPLSPAMKSAFEQVYGPPYLARLLFAEVGPKPAEDLFLRVEYDGAIATNGGAVFPPHPGFAVFGRSGEKGGVLGSFF